MTIQDDLRLYGRHDGHSSDTHVRMCAGIHKAADYIDKLEAENERLRSVVCELGQLNPCNSNIGIKARKMAHKAMAQEYD